ncbi:hypothetical protein KAT63_04985 [Candidatus Parcubacteria bacterium]|nr:hypothetical protein [Candidatus Parcubacteria bacterium]
MIEKKTESEVRKLTVLKNRLKEVGRKSESLPLESVEELTEVARVLREITSEAINNGGNINFEDLRKLLVEKRSFENN